MKQEVTLYKQQGQEIMHIYDFNGGRFDFFFLLFNICIMSLIDFPAERSTEPNSTPCVWLHSEGGSAGQAVWYPEGEAVYEVHQQI